MRGDPNGETFSVRLISTVATNLIHLKYGIGHGMHAVYRMHEFAKTEVCLPMYDVLALLLIPRCQQILRKSYVLSNLPLNDRCTPR